MSSRAASSGGFCMPRKNAAATRYGTAVTAPRVMSAGTNRPVVSAAAMAGVRTRAFSSPRLSSRSPSWPPARTPASGAEPDHEQERARERLVDPVLLFRELEAERLQAGEEVVAADARRDQDDVRAHAQHVAGCAHEPHAPGRTRV